MEKQENSLVVFDVEVDHNEFEGYKNKAFIKERSKYKIPGFRTGKAPRNLIERNYGAGVFVEEGLNILANDAYHDAISKFEVVPVSRPEMDLKKLDDEEPIQFSISVVIEPEVELCDYKGIEVSVNVPEVTENDVNAKLQEIAMQNARIDDVTDRDTVEENDTVYMDYKCFVDGVLVEENSNNTDGWEIGKGKLIKEFEEKLIGAKIGQPLEFELESTNKEGSQEIKVFNVTVTAIKEQILPTLDDEFAQDVSEFDTLDEYKKDLEESLKNAREKEVKNQIENSIMDKLIDNCSVEIPEVMEISEKESLKNYMQYMISNVYNMDMNSYFRFTNKTEEEFFADINKSAITNIKTRLITKKIYKEEFSQNDQSNHSDNSDDSDKSKFKKVMDMLVENVKFI